MRCSSVVLPEPERPSTATSRPRVNAASKPDEHLVRPGSAAVALVDPAQLAHDLAADGRLALRAARRRGRLAVAGELRPRPRLPRQLARPPMPASSRALSGSRTQPPRPTTSRCGPPRTQLAADAPVAHVHDAVGELGRGLVVADDHERRPAAGDQLAEQAVDGARRARVELARRLVGQQQRRRVGERRAGRDALLLAARERRGRVVGAVCESHAVEQRQSARPALARRDASERERQRDVVGAGERGGEGARVVLIEEAEALRAERRRPPRAEPHDVDAERARDAGRRPVEARGDAQQRALARSARAEHDAALALLDRERHPLQRDGARRAVRVDAEDVAELECERAGHSAHCSPVTPRPAAPRR